MRALAYEGRRLIGIRSTWIALVITLSATAIVAALTARHALAGPLSSSAAVRLLTGAVPLMPLPLAAFGAGTLGALSYGHEVRHFALRATLVSPSRRLRLLGAKLVVVGMAAAALSLASLALDGVVLHFALPADSALGTLSRPDRLLPALLGFMLVVAAAGWVGLLAAGLLRSTAGGLLVLLGLPTIAEPAAGAVLRRADADQAGQVSGLLPFQAGRDWMYGAAHSAYGPFTAADAASLGMTLVPVAVLLLACIGVQLGRRTI